MRYWLREAGTFIVILSGFIGSCNNCCYASTSTSTDKMHFSTRPVSSVMGAAIRRHSSSLVVVGASRGKMPPAFTARTLHTGRNNMAKSLAHHEQAPKQNQRRRRGAIRLHKLEMRQTSHGERMASSPLMAISDDETIPAITQYTINDSICPPTDPDTLEKIVQKHVYTLPKYWKSKPIAKHNAEAFEEALDFIIKFNDQSPGDSLKTRVILDSGCGTGRSSHLLGNMFRDCVVIGIDQSLARLSRNKSYNQHNEKDNRQTSPDDTRNENSNVLLLRAELSDFWKCCLSSSRWQRHVHLHQHYLLYPNPYPKKARLKNRFYAHPAFPLLMMTMMMEEGDNGDKHIEGRKIVLRSNWKGFLEEFNLAVGVWGDTGGNFKEFRSMMSDGEDCDEWHPKASPVKWEVIGPERLTSNDKRVPLTNFEAKYLECGEPVYELSILKD